MTLVELQKALRAADAGAVLVPARILEQIIQEACNLRGSVWNTPHRECFVVDRQTLFRHIEQAYLDLEPDQLLPEIVILLARPPAEELSDLESKQVLLKYWRRLFHASVHLALDAHHGQSEDKLPDERVHERVEEIGRAEFDEIRSILMQDRFLLPGASDREVYVEFAAVYLETRWFAGSVLPAMFPALRDFPRTERMLARDVDARALFENTRLRGAPDPIVAMNIVSDEPQSHEQYWTLVRNAEKANLDDNLVRAAILRLRASRIAPAALGQRTRDQALGDMKRLTARLTSALRLGTADEEQWGKTLPLLLEKADQGAHPAEARLLYELQRICSESERDLFALDLIEWVLSAGKRPIKRPLPRLRQVRITRILHNTIRYLAVVRLHEADRRQFADLVQAALDHAEQKIRDDFGKVLHTALEDVGLRPVNPPERVARAKMVAEWLDRIITHGFVTFSDLRDAISRNQLKMPDLKDPRDLLRGDQLLRLDRRLASLLDGVYRPSDIYMRWLEQLTAINFGTESGRKVTLWFTLPFGGAYLLMQLLGLILHFLISLQQHPRALWFYHVLVGQARDGDSSRYGPHLPWHLVLLAMIGTFLMALLHARQFRQRMREAMAVVRRGLRTAFIEWPTELVHLAAWQRLLRSWQFQLSKAIFKPLVVTGIIWLVLPTTARLPFNGVLLLVVITLALNSRLGHAFTEAGWQIIRTFVKLLRAGLLPGLYRLIMRIFKQVLDTVDFVLFTVDDWLRYRKGDSVPSLVFRTCLGVLWFPISYLARFFTIVMIEPGFNPAKAPVSYLAAKVTWPFAPKLVAPIVLVMTPFIGHWLAEALAWPTVWLLPDAFGFLFWETSENWNLYRANRRQTLRAVSIGPRGETLKSLLIPGFHSGVVPRLYARLREAEQRACWTRNWAGARAIREQLDEIGRAVERFVTRELLAILQNSSGWQDQRIMVGKVDVTVKRITVELLSPDNISRPMRIEFELRESSLVAAISIAGWLDRLTPAQLHSFTAALASLYKLAAVDLVVEHVKANLPAMATRWDVTPEGLAIWLDDKGPPVLFYLREADEPVNPKLVTSDAAVGSPTIEARRLIFARRPLYWQQWVSNWEKPSSNGQPHPGENDWHSELVSLPPAPQQAGAA